MSGSPAFHTQFPLLFAANEPLSQQKLQQILGRYNQLRAAGQTEASSPELHQGARFIEWFKRQNANRPQPPPQQQQHHVNGIDLAKPADAPALDATPTITPAQQVPVVPLSPDVPPDPITFSDTQLDSLRNQIAAFRHISRGLPIPASVRDSLFPSDTSATDLRKEVDGKDVVSRVVDSAVQVQKASEAADGADDSSKNTGPKVAFPSGPLMENDTESGIHPFNAFTHPLDLLKRKPPVSALHASKQQRLLIPSLMPAGLDPYQLLAERNRFIESRIAHRIKELSSLSSSMGEGGLELPISLKPKREDYEEETSRYTHPGVNAHGKLRALIELKSLQLREKQRALRLSIVQRLGEATALTTDRKEFKRYRKQSVRDARNTEKLERQQRADRERRVKQKHIDYLNTICNHGRELITANRVAQSKVHRLGRAVLKFHADTEKEEQKRVERLAKERLKALKADDEEAYLKLIDTAKDTRITHLLKQTSSFLESLTSAVQAHQLEGSRMDETAFGASRMEDEDGDAGKIDYYSVAHRIQEKVTMQPGILVGGKLKEYQIKGLQWMVSLYNNRLNGILADEMGLGKTIQTISLITFLIESKRQKGPYLVIVPLSTLPNWTLEFEKWAPAVSTAVYKGSPAARKALQTQLRMTDFTVMLTTFEYIIKDRPFLSKYKWVHMIIDEGHRMKNTQSKLSQTLTQYYTSRYRLILTGTPLQNNLPELWSLLNFVLPKIFNSVKSFDEWFNTPFANTGGQENIQLNEEESLLIIRRLHKVLRPFLLRRLKKDVESELPDKVEKVIKCKMSALQSQLYKYMVQYKMFPNDKADATGRPVPVRGLQNMVMQLRKICQHPFVFPEVDAAVNPTHALNDTVIRTAGKVALLDRMLPKLFRTGHRVLIFYQMTNVMDILGDFMDYRGYAYLRLDGSTKTEERGELLKKFNAPGSEFNIFMLSTRAGGLGLNLQTADTVIIYDSDWNPHADLQAQDRAHRIGQKKAVRIFRFITEKSVEEAILTRAKFKLDMDEKVIQAGRFDNKSTQEEQEEYLRSLVEDRDDELQEPAGEMTDEELNELLARSDEEQVIFKQIDIQRDADEQTEWVLKGGIGPKPETLMQMHEIPAIYQQEDPFPVSEKDDQAEGRGARIRKDVRYNDGLTDDQWTQALEDEADMADEIAEQRRVEKRGRKPKRLVQSGQSTPVPEVESLPRKRGRGKGKIRDLEPSPVPPKRKRGVKEQSLTPSVNDEDEDDDAPVRDSKRRKTGVPPPSSGLSADVKERMKKVFAECHRVVTNISDGERKRCELFKELPSKKDYADYYKVIESPIAISTIRKRSNANHYKTVEQYAEDWRLLFNNARTYNQEGSWVYNDAEEMQRIFEATFYRLTAGTDLPGAPPHNGHGGGRSSQQLPPSSGGYNNESNSALSEEDDEPPRRGSGRGRKLKDDSDDDYEGQDD